tara:strand:- start:2838 stop:4058 length:1221 start_codon:yes stop_codon:yes gene_type:complete
MTDTIFNINGREMVFQKNNDIWEKGEVHGDFILPVLSTTNKHGNNVFWRIYVKNNKIFRQMRTGSDGKVRIFPEIECFGKNIGKKNETTDNQQALFEAYSMWLKKQDQNYKPFSENLENDSSQSENILPMLANKYEQRKKYLNKPFGVSPKLDGVRVIARFQDENLVLTSRLGKEFIFMNKLREHLNKVISNDIILDGELYSHTIPFNAISGTTRAKKTPSKYDSMIEMWIFDIVDENKSYEDRMKELKKIQNVYDKKFNKKKKLLKFVYYEQVSTDKEVKSYHDKFVEKGYEGVMCRNLNGKYKLKHRSNDLLKYKNFEDSEFKIVDAKKGTGTEEGAIVFTCENENGDRFDVRPRGEIEKRRQMFQEKEKYFGKMLTVRYQNTGIEEIDSLPRFPVGIEVRDYE